MLNNVMTIFYLLCSLLLPWSAHAETIYVSNEKDNTVSVIDGQSYEVKKTIPVGKRPRGIALDSSNTALYICASEDNRIELLDLKQFKVTKFYPTDDPELLLVDSPTNRLYVGNENLNLLTVFDLKSGKVIKEIPVDKEPEGIAISPNKKIVAVTAEASNSADLIDTKSLQLIE